VSKATPASAAGVTKASRREDTIRRAGGTGDDFHMTWSANGRLFTSLCDGHGWDDPPACWWNSSLHEVFCGPDDARFSRLNTYPSLVANWAEAKEFSRYYGFGTIAADGHVYQYLSTPNVSFLEAGPRFVGVKLIYSADEGMTWRNQDGTTPVIWEGWEERSTRNMLFFCEPDEAFAQISILQMGRGYEANEDGYVYGYSPNGNVDGKMNELVMFRVPRREILDRFAYEFFAGREPGGGAHWTRVLADRGPVHAFPRGFVNKTVHPWSWLPSVAYNEALGLYMMLNAGTGVGREGEWFGKPSYLGIWLSTAPWGPWHQVMEEEEWLPAGDSGARAYSPTIVPKWIAPDGRSFWMTWADYQTIGGPSVQAEREEQVSAYRSGSIDMVEFTERMIAWRPYYQCNMQRVDLTVA
jgi:hypothetical protein